MQTIVTMKWGDRYSSDYANRLWSAVKRNTTRPTRMICYTDDPRGLDPSIEIHSLPPYAAPANMLWDGWRKISVWGPDVAGLVNGTTALFLDLDLILTGGLDAFFDYEPDATYCVIENWTQPGLNIGNTSVFRWRVGAHPDLFARMQADPERYKRRYGIEQTYISGLIPDQKFWPRDWCVSFKHSLLPRFPLNLFYAAELPETVRIVAFTGKPDPDEARDGVWPAKGWKKLYKQVRPTPWIAEHWR